MKLWRTAATVLATVLACAVLGGLVTTACGSSDSSAASAYCEQVAQVDALDIFSDPAPASVERDLLRLLALTRSEARVAPRAIRDDAREAAKAQVRFNALYRAHGWHAKATVTDPAFIALAGDQHLAKVYFRLERYQIRTCHDDGTPAPASPAPA